MPEISLICLWHLPLIPGNTFSEPVPPDLETCCFLNLERSPCLLPLPLTRPHFFSLGLNIII